ncbi:MAG: hypothetical protein QOE34_2365, partial [Verrucomicrobiota bacterium]
MRKTPASESGAFNPRLFFAFTLCAAAALLALVSLAAPIGSGTLSPTNKSITYTGGPFLGATNPSDNA